uniref:Recep_L_domain domain-containing protein n=1 Tax=Caenorhabditis tropicalis TaxID=1561998 RepID=A0A1I7UAW0_9PELO
MTEQVLEPFGLKESKFIELCEKKGVDRCTHLYNQTLYEGTICCEKNANEIFSSWLWDTYFGVNEELKTLLDNSILFMKRENQGKIDDHDDIGFLYVIGPFFVTTIFTALSLLQYYHINDGILS